jgi:hypothetical protein
MVCICSALLALTVSCSACDGGGRNAIGFIEDKIDALAGKGAYASVKEDEDAPAWDNAPKVLVNEATGEKIFEDGGATVDYSNADQGYVMVKYEGGEDKVKVRIAHANAKDEPYTYDLDPDGEFQALPLTQSDGGYDIGVYTNIEGDKYALAAQQTVKTKLKDEFLPFLRPSQYVAYTVGSACVAKASELTEGSRSDIGAAEQIFLYVIGNVEYDYDKAGTLQSDYLPNVDETLESGTGICFDYAALTVAMLRSQGIPCKLIIGYAGSAYHSWIAIYSKVTGEFAAIIEFKGDAYNFADPTFTAAGDEANPNIVSDGVQYQPIYYY